MSADTVHAARTCSACDTGTYQSSLSHRDTNCVAHTACTLGVTCQTVAPTITSNRVCSAVNTCGENQYLSVPYSLDHNGCGTCASVSDCTSAQYESAPKTTTSDRQCSVKECTCANGVGRTGANCAKGKISIKYKKIMYIQNYMCLQRSNFTAARFCA